jgi:hypothetical protein
MNKILPYVLIAIFLGTITIVIPYALLGPRDNTSLTDGGTLIQPSAQQPNGTEQPDSEGQAFSEGRDVESVPSSPNENPPAEELRSEDAGSTLGNLSNLSPIVLITIPGFLIALGAFIILKKKY